MKVARKFCGTTARLCITCNDFGFPILDFGLSESNRVLTTDRPSFDRCIAVGRIRRGGPLCPPVLRGRYRNILTAGGRSDNPKSKIPNRTGGNRGLSYRREVFAARRGLRQSHRADQVRGRPAV